MSLTAEQLNQCQLLSDKVRDSLEQLNSLLSECVQVGMQANVACNSLDMTMLGDTYRRTYPRVYVELSLPIRS